MANWLQIFEEAVTIAGEVEGIEQEIDQGEAATSPPVHTFIDGHGGNITLTWTPDGGAHGNADSGGSVSG